MFSALFHSILYQPIFNAFIALYNFVPGHDVGIVIFIITVIIRLILYPLTSSSIKSQKALQELQPKMEAIKKLYPSDQQKQAQATMELYKTNKVNPFSSCLPMLIQLPVLIALYLVMRDGLASTNVAQNLYPFVHNPGQIDATTIAGINLGKPNMVLAVLAGLAQFVQTKMLSRKNPPPAAGAGGKDEGMMAMMNKQMLYFMPVMTVVIGFSLPAGLTLYWFLSTALMALQQLILFKKDKTNTPGTPVIEGEVVK